MASIGHIAVGMAAARFWNRKRWVNAAFNLSMLSLWPDIDAVGFRFGIRYEDAFGHRGASHSLLLAVVVALGAYAYARWKELPALRTSLVAGVVAMSHGVLDTMTFGGGLGCALLWPFSTERIWAPEALRIIPVSPIGLGIVSTRGLYVLAVETLIFSPFFVYALKPRR
jgi:inner membrane protein